MESGNREFHCKSNHTNSEIIRGSTCRIGGRGGKREGGDDVPTPPRFPMMSASLSVCHPDSDQASGFRPGAGFSSASPSLQDVWDAGGARDAEPDIQTTGSQNTTQPTSSMHRVQINWECRCSSPSRLRSSLQQCDRTTAPCHPPTALPSFSPSHSLSTSWACRG